MTPRSIQWIADSGLLVGLTTIGEFAATPVLTALSLSSSNFALAVAASGAILGATAGSVITAAGLPAGLTINPAPGWAYDGSGAIGSYTFSLTETLSSASNSPMITGITMTVFAPAAPSATLDFTQSIDSDMIAALRSF